MTAPDGNPAAQTVCQARSPKIGVAIAEAPGAVPVPVSAHISVRHQDLFDATALTATPWVPDHFSSFPSPSQESAFAPSYVPA